MQPGVEVLLGSLSLDALGVMFCAHPLKGTLRSCQSILPCNDDAFSTAQLPLSGKELLLQPGGHHQRHHHAWRRRRPTPIDKRESGPQQEASTGNHKCRVKPHLVDDEA
jgi:hypothetical protein